MVIGKPDRCGPVDARYIGGNRMNDKGARVRSFEEMAAI
jgi:hypothetical protein